MARGRKKDTGGSQKYQNTFSFKPNPFCSKTKKILQLPNEGVCEKCWKIIEWRKQFGKYKPLTVPSKCTSCGLKRVKYAYHTQCSVCATAKNACAKCTHEPISKMYTFGIDDKRAEQEALLDMNERQKRTYFRNKGKKPKKNIEDKIANCQSDDLVANSSNSSPSDDKNSSSEGSDLEEDTTHSSQETSDIESFETDSEELDELDMEIMKLQMNTSYTKNQQIAKEIIN